MAKNEYPKETGGGWYELSDGTKVQGEEEAKQAEADLGKSGTSGSGSDPAVANRVDEGTGLENLAVDREVSADSDGERIGDDEDDPRGGLPVAGLPVIGRAESGEPIVAGGVPTMTTGVSAEDAGVNDPNIGVASDTGTTLARHEARRDEWGAGSLDPEKSDGSPADRIKTGEGPYQAEDSDGTDPEDNQKS